MNNPEKIRLKEHQKRAEVEMANRKKLSQYLDLCALAEIINGLPLKFSHFHHPTILGSLQSIKKLAMG